MSDGQTSSIAWGDPGLGAGQIAVAKAPLDGGTPSVLVETNIEHGWGRTLVACDVTGDGIDDLITVRPNWATLDASHAAAWYGAASSVSGEPDWSLELPLPPQEAVADRSWAGADALCLDGDGDGVHDLLVGDLWRWIGGRWGVDLNLYRGGPAGLPSVASFSLSFDAPSFRRAQGLSDSSLAGNLRPAWSIAVSVGDLNEDGADDILVPLIAAGEEWNDLHLLLGGPDGFVEVPFDAPPTSPLSRHVAFVGVETYLATIRSDDLGWPIWDVHTLSLDGAELVNSLSMGPDAGVPAEQALVALGDLDGDLRPELLASGPAHLDEDAWIAIWQDAPTALGAPTWTVTSGSYQPAFARIMKVVDVNEDGRNDLVVNSPDDENHGVFVYLGCLDEDGDGRPDSADCVDPPEQAPEDLQGCECTSSAEPASGTVLLLALVGLLAFERRSSRCREQQ